jgi:hypothetical protein
MPHFTKRWRNLIFFNLYTFEYSNGIKRHIHASNDVSVIGE